MGIQKFKVGDMVVGNDDYRYFYTKKGWVGKVTAVHRDGKIEVYGECGNHKQTFDVEPKYFDLVPTNEYKIGDRVVIEKSNIESTHPCAGKIGTITDGPIGNTYKWEVKVDGTKIWCDIKCRATEQDEKIVITHDGKTTTATMYCADGSKKTATARCAPEDTFNFKFGAQLAMVRLMGNSATNVDPTVEWRVVDRMPRVGDYIRLRTSGGYDFSKPGDILKVDRTGISGLVFVYGKNHPRPTDDPNFEWTYTKNEYEVVEKVTAVEPKPEPPKYYNGKVVCVKSDDFFFTVGKIYEIVDGKFLDNRNTVRPMTKDRVSKVEDLSTGYFKNWAYNFIPLVEDEDKNKPLTTEELMKMDGKKVWLSSLVDDKEKFDDEYCGWHTVNVNSNKVIGGDGRSYKLTDNGDPYGFLAYRNKPTK